MDAIKRILLIGYTISCLAALLACAAPPPERRIESLFQSVCAVTLYGAHDDADFSAVWTRLREIDAMMSMWKEDSALSRINAAAGAGPVPAPPEIRDALAHALALARVTGGRYDPTVGPLVKRWGVGTANARVPSREEIASALALLGSDQVTIDRENGTVRLARAGMALDFGSVAKGYGAREAGRLLRRRGFRSALIDIGGCVVAVGARPDGKPWRIGVQEPSGARGTAVIGYFLAVDAAVATSGIYERSFEQGGRVYHHLMDTRTGYPIDNGVISVSVLVDRNENPDGPPLALLVMGAEAGIALADQLQLAAVMIGADKTVRVSKAARERFVLTDPSYTIK